MKNSIHHLRRLLYRRGYHQGKLVDAVSAWEHDHANVLEPESIPGRITNDILPKLIHATKKSLLKYLDVQLTGPWKTLEEVPFDGLEFRFFPDDLKVPDYITGSHAYFGGEQDGRPALRSLFEYNRAYHMTDLSLLALCLHEFIPGHELSGVVTDLLFREGRLGFEATVQTMASPQVVLWEGLAQNAMGLLFDTRGEAYQILGYGFGFEPIDLEIQDALDRVMDIAKHNAPYLHEVRGFNEQGIRDYSRGLGLSGNLPTKVWGWARNPVIGAMYGTGYGCGEKVVANRIQRHGRIKVAEVALGINEHQAFLDIQTFQQMLP